MSFRCHLGRPRNFANLSDTRARSLPSEGRRGSPTGRPTARRPSERLRQPSGDARSSRGAMVRPGVSVSRGRRRHEHRFPCAALQAGRPGHVSRPKPDATPAGACSVWARGGRGSDAVVIAEGAPSRSATRQRVEDQFGGYPTRRQAINGPSCRASARRPSSRANAIEPLLPRRSFGGGPDGRPRAAWHGRIGANAYSPTPTGDSRCSS